MHLTEYNNMKAKLQVLQNVVIALQDSVEKITKNLKTLKSVDDNINMQLGFLQMDINNIFKEIGKKDSA